MTTTTDLKPGDVVQHSEHGYGIFYVAAAGSLVMHRNAKGHVDIDDLDEGWERVETCTWHERQWLDYRGGVRCTCDTYPETTSGPEEDCEIHGRPYGEWVKRAAEAEAELARAGIVKPGHVQVRVDDLDLSTTAGRVSAIERLDEACPPPQPDEPTGLGAVVEVGGRRFVRTDEDGHPWIDSIACWWHWDDLTSRGPVTVLSEGLAS